MIDSGGSPTVHVVHSTSSGTPTAADPSAAASTTRGERGCFDAISPAKRPLAMADGNCAAPQALFLPPTNAAVGNTAAMAVEMNLRPRDAMAMKEGDGSESRNSASLPALPPQPNNKGGGAAGYTVPAAATPTRRKANSGGHSSQPERGGGEAAAAVAHRASPVISHKHQPSDGEDADEGDDGGVIIVDGPSGGAATAAPTPTTQGTGQPSKPHSPGRGQPTPQDASDGAALLDAGPPPSTTAPGNNHITTAGGGNATNPQPSTTTTGGQATNSRKWKQLTFAPGTAAPVLTAASPPTAAGSHALSQPSVVADNATAAAAAAVGVTQQLKTMQQLLQQHQDLVLSLRRELSDKDSRIEELQRKISQSDECLCATKAHHDAQERSLVGRLSRYQSMMQSVMLDVARTHRREARRAQHQLHFDLGQVLSVPSPMGGNKDVWINGNRARDLMHRLDELSKRQLKVENEKKQARAKALAAAQLAATLEDSTNGCSNGFAQLDAQLDADVVQDLAKAELLALKQTETQLRGELDSIEVKKVAFCKEIRRINDEDASPYGALAAIGENMRFVLIHLLGKGGFSEVWKAFDLVEARFVACKIHHIQSNWTAATRAHYLRHAERELEIQRKLDHPRLTKLFDVFAHDDNTFVSVMEYSEGEDLDLYLKRERTMKENDARLVMVQLLSALRHLFEQERPIIHYDLKPANILFHSSEPSCLDIKVTDFGLSKIVAAEGNTAEEGIELTSQGTGTYWYQPPECFDTAATPKISHKVDIWAAGVIFYQMLYGKKPFGDGESQKKIWLEKTIMHRAREQIDFPASVKVSAEAKEVIRRMLAYSPHDRPDIVALSREPYFCAAAATVGRKRTRAGGAAMGVAAASSSSPLSTVAQAGSAMGATAASAFLSFHGGSPVAALAPVLAAGGPGLPVGAAMGPPPERPE